MLKGWGLLALGVVVVPSGIAYMLGVRIEYIQLAAIALMALNQRIVSR